MSPPVDQIRHGLHKAFCRESLTTVALTSNMLEVLKYLKMVTVDKTKVPSSEYSCQSHKAVNWEISKKGENLETNA